MRKFIFHRVDFVIADLELEVQRAANPEELQRLKTLSERQQQYVQLR